ncbi:MAG: hypothetical protein ACMXYC_05125 [Candidatus Woesearchaeota archaeon]
MKELVQKVGLKKEPGFLYFIDTQGNIVQTPMHRSAHKTQRVVAHTNITRDSTYLYYVDKQGDICRTLRKSGR